MAKTPPIFEYRYIHTPECPEYSITSQHPYGKAADFDVKGYTSAEVNQWLIANRNEPELRGVTFIEMGMNWTHIDTRPTTDDELLQLKTWKKYRVLLNRVDTSTAPDIDWPEKPTK